MTTAHRTGRRGLGRIVAASLAISALTLPMTPDLAAAAPGAVRAPHPVQQQDPPGGQDDPPNDGGGSRTDDPGTDPGSGTDDPSTDPGNGGTDDPGSTTPGPDRPGGGIFNPPRTGTPPAGIPDPDADAAEQERLRQQLEAEEAAREAEEARLEAIERQRKEAAERAERARKARETWEKKDRPRHMVTVRTDRVEVVDNGRLTTLVPRRPGTLSLGQLDRMLPSDWIKVDGGAATVDTTIVLTPGAAMEFDEEIPTVRLTGGPEVSDASAIYTGGGRLTITGVTINGIDRGSQQPLPFEALGRPFIEVTGGGKLEVEDSTITDLGVPEHKQESARPAVSFNPDSTGSLVRTTFQRNTIGVEVSRANDVNLEAVTVTESEEDGLVLNGDRGTKMAGIRAENNGGNGVSVGGETTERPITGISTLGNELYGVAVSEQEGAQVNGIVTEGDGAGGLRLNQAVDVHVNGFTATDQPIGIFTHVGSTGVVLEGVEVSGGRRGVVVEKSTTDLELRNSRVEGSRVSGVNIGGKDIRVHSVQVVDAKAGVRVERGAGRIELTEMTIDGGRDGIVTSAGTEGIVVNDLTVNHVEDDAIRTASPGMQINGGTITGGTTGIDVAAAATINAITINGASEGIYSRSPELVRAENISVDTIDLGLNVAPGCPFVLANSNVHALEAVRGEFMQEGVNNFSLPPLNLLGAIGVPLILLAIVLEQVHSFRQRRFGVSKRRGPPAIPVGAG